MNGIFSFCFEFPLLYQLYFSHPSGIFPPEIRCESNWKELLLWERFARPVNFCWLTVISLVNKQNWSFSYLSPPHYEYPLLCSNKVKHNWSWHLDLPWALAVVFSTKMYEVLISTKMYEVLISGFSIGQLLFSSHHS